LYTGTPNLITLISFMLFTFSAFFLIVQKKKTYFYISISSFLMIAYLFLFLVKV
jgi:phosphatidylglycerophosphate synthase